jgi:hypothetical protein
MQFLEKNVALPFNKQTRETKFLSSVNQPKHHIKVKSSICKEVLFDRKRDINLSNFFWVSGAKSFWVKHLFISTIAASLSCDSLYEIMTFVVGCWKALNALYCVVCLYAVEALKDFGRSVVISNCDWADRTWRRSRDIQLKLDAYTLFFFVDKHILDFLDVFLQVLPFGISSCLNDSFDFLVEELSGERS